MEKERADLVRQVETMEAEANKHFEIGYELLVQVNALKAKLVAPVVSAEINERVMLARDKLIAFGAAADSERWPAFALVAHYIHHYPGITVKGLRRFLPNVPRTQIMLNVGPSLATCREGYFFIVDGPENNLSLYPPLFGDPTVAAAYAKIKRGP